MSASEASERLTHLARGFEWNARSNRSMVDTLRRAGDTAEEGVALLSHLLAAERVWLDRLHGTARRPDLAPDWDLARCATEAADVAAAWARTLEGLDANGLAREVAYRDSAGASQRHRVEEILLHVIAHSALHHAEIMLTLGAGERDPGFAGQFEAVRLKLVE